MTDLKPENIFIVPDPVAPLGERVKLLDFGIAKFLDGPVRKTTVGMILGTPLYMSPEQCEGSEDLDDKVDVYALGVMLYEMISGQLPFVADTAAALMRQHMFKEAPPLAEKGLDLPEDLAALIHKMLAKRPAARPSMADITTRLEALLPQLNGKHATPQSIVPSPNSARRNQIVISAPQSNTDPFARTLGPGDKESAADPFSQTVAEGGIAIHRETATVTKGRTTPARAPSSQSPRNGVASHDEREKKEAGRALPSLGRTTSRTQSQLPLLLAATLAGVVALGIGAVRYYKSSLAPKAVSSPTPTAPAAPPSVEPTAAAVKPDAAHAATASATEEGADEASGSTKGHSKKSKSRSGSRKRTEDSESKRGGKSRAAHNAKSDPSEEPDVWR